jgi:ankyrin repeat protein
VSSVDINQAPHASQRQAVKSWTVCVRALLQKRQKHSGANVHQRDDFKRTCLYACCSCLPLSLRHASLMYYAAALDTPDDEQHDIVQMLLASGCKPNASDELQNSVLARAFCDSSASIVGLLLQSQAVLWPHEKSRVIDCLCRKVLPHHLQLLLEHAELLDIEAFIAPPQLERMLLTTARAVVECSSLIQLLLHKGAHVDARDGCGLTPLMAACASSGCDSTIEALVAAGADVNLVSPSGAPALLILCRERSKLTSHAVTVLLDAGAARSLKTVDAVTKQSCLHHLALRSGKKQQHLHDQRQVFECAARLTSAGADTRQVDVLGRNCLHYAYMNGTLKEYNVALLMLQVCLKDEVTHKDVYGKVPKDYEAFRGRAVAGDAAAEASDAAVV